MSSKKTPKKTKKQTKEEKVTIKPPNFQRAKFRIKGITPYVQCKFSEKARRAIIEGQEEGEKSKKGKKRKPKDFKEMYQNSMHISEQGWNGIPCSAFRAAMVSACRVAGFKMSVAKLAFWLIPDGMSNDGITPLVKITKGRPKQLNAPVSISKGKIDILPRAMWEKGWEAELTIEFDADQFDLNDVANLVYKAGWQVNVGCGRNDSKQSAGVGWGKFTTINEKGKK